MSPPQFQLYQNRLNHRFGYTKKKDLVVETSSLDPLYMAEPSTYMVHWHIFNGKKNKSRFIL